MWARRGLGDERVGIAGNWRDFSNKGFQHGFMAYGFDKEIFFRTFKAMDNWELFSLVGRELLFFLRYFLVGLIR